MITIRGIDINFSITNPADMRRLHTAQQNAGERESEAKAPTDTEDPEYILKYADWLNELLNVFGNFIDEAFGDGVAEKLLTNNPDFAMVFDVNDELEEALGIHVKAFTTRFDKYKPNRAARRAKI